ncbi:hypothetical protein CAMRE0001_3244 [Campylobacter rectus RM3267]|uniref:Uncharacterized protein n=1 Tax=Campylobacter rectus RM3267 TaxID=553218 RepID=B9D502_CAMRE|nr:hypothetical protein CAMRE0001_3244 [Campylobacter rectus RM3267]
MLQNGVLICVERVVDSVSDKTSVLKISLGQRAYAAFLRFSLY